LDLYGLLVRFLSTERTFANDYGRASSSRESGFTAFYALQTGHAEMLTISVFATQAGAEGSTPLASAWVTQNLAGFIHKELETTVGQIFSSSFGPSSHEGLA
jgi:hypothetical protein